MDGMSGTGTAVGATAWGALSGLLLADHHGVPEWIVVAAVSASLFAGMWQAAMSPAKAEERTEARRQAVGSAAALWVISLVAVHQADMGASAAAMAALVIGLLGGRALDALENSATGRAVLDRIARWWLGGK